MRSNIFEIENRLDIQKEYERLTRSLFESNILFYESEWYSLFEFLNKCIFCLWDYRDTFIDIFEYMEHIGVELNDNAIISEESFLNFMELLLNLWKTAKKKINFNRIVVISPISFNVIDHNIPIILEKMNYTTIDDYDKVLIVKRDADVDSILDFVPKTVSSLLLSYNDIRNNNINAKKKILKDLDLYVEKNKKTYKSYDNSLYDSIQTIVNEMGINHPINDKFTNLLDFELCNWYDKCFKMMIHLIRIEDIIKIKNERNQLINQNN